MENTGVVATPLGVPAKGDRFSAIGAGDQDMIYQINENEVIKEEWTQFHSKRDDQWKQRQERVEENMNKICEPEDHEEVMGENHHNDDDPPH